MIRAALLIAHGSRRAAANDDLVQLAKLIRERNLFPIVEIAYLELAEPTIPTAARVCVDRGAECVRMFPYFLSAGEHVSGDLEKFRVQFGGEYPDVQFELCPPLGLHPLIVEVALERLQQPLTKSDA